MPPKKTPAPKTTRKKNEKRTRDEEDLIQEQPEVTISDSERDKLVSEVLAKYPANPLRALWETLKNKDIKAPSVALAIINNPNCGLEKRAEESASKQVSEISIGATPLLIAARAGRADVIKTLLSLNVDTKAVDTHGRTALHMAALSDSAEAIKVLLNHGLDIEAKDTFGNTPLFLAARSYFHGFPKVAALVSAGACVTGVDAKGFPILHYASDVPSIKLLASKGADPNIVNQGVTPLITAAIDGDENKTDGLLAVGANPEAKDENGWTALHHAANGAYYNIICSLIKGGAKTSTRNAAGHTPNMVFMNGLVAGEFELHDYEAREISRKLFRLSQRKD